MVPILASWGALRKEEDDFDGEDEEDLNGEVGGLWERFDQQTRKNGLHKINFVLRSDNSSVNAVPSAANRVSRLQCDIQNNS
jgi:hypothetical protein